jgi:ATP-dependent DNA helicase RecG
VRLEIEDGTVDGSAVVVARVSECDRSAKPCRVASTGKVYIRSYDGDFLLSDLEEQAFLAARRPPMFDRAPVEDATADDLDEALAESFAASIRGQDPDGLGRFADRSELLRRSGVLHADGRPTVAEAAAEPLPGAQPGTRARNQVTIDGPIPRMLDRAMEWARRTFDTAIVTAPDGSVHDRSAYPLVAFRELIVNTLIHRDLDDWSAGLAIEVRLRRDRLVITNPGGLYGITADRLGRDSVTSARNARLVAICQHVYSAETGARAIEALASGIPIVTDALAGTGLPPAHYIDSGIRFTVIVSQPQPAPSAAPATRDQVIYDALGNVPATVADLEARTGLPAYTIRRSLRGLKA